MRDDESLAEQAMRPLEPLAERAREKQEQHAEAWSSVAALIMDALREDEPGS